MFTGKKFLFIKFGVDFNGKRINIFKDLTKKFGGEIFEEENLCDNNLPDFLITSPKNLDLIFELSKKLNNESLKKIKKISLNYEWFSYCIREKIFIEYSSYIIKFNDSMSKKKDNLIKEFFPRNKFSLSQEITNKILISNLNIIKEENEEKKENEILFDKIKNDIINNKINDNESEEETNFSEEEKEKIHKKNSLSEEKKIEKNKKLNNIKNSFSFLSKKEKNLNEEITNELEKILEFHNNEGNIFNALAYRRAINIIKKHGKKIEHINDIPKKKGIGTKIKEKIKEIILTGKCKKSEYVSKDKKNKSINILSKVYGVGIKQANLFYQKGIRTIEDLQKISNELPLNIQKGLKYYNDIIKKIPREEIDEIYNLIKEELYKILPEKVIKIEVCGSYRRLKKFCGDIDILITRIDDGLIDNILNDLINILIEKKIIVDTLSLSDNSKGENQCYIFMGIYKWKSNIFRRIDIKVYQKNLFPFALLYFTGSAFFNRSMRLFAKHKGFHLSDKELSLRKSGVKIICNEEKDIFEKLGIEYKEPWERDI